MPAAGILEPGGWERLRAKLDPDALAALETLGNTARDEERKLREQGKSHGLEDPLIRTLVCQYLEGGEEAFRRRAERYGEIVKRRTMAR